MPPLPSLISAFAIAVTACLAHVASADPTPTDPADVLFQEGKKLVNDGDLPAGRAKYEQAYALKPSADIACNLGSVEVSLKDFAKGAEHLDECLRIFPATGTPQQKTMATNLLASAKAEVAEVHVTANKDAARLFVDGRDTGLLPRSAALYLSPGTHALTAKLEGFEATPVEIVATKGATSDVQLRLERTDGAKDPKSHRTLVPAIVGFVLGGVGVAIGIGTAIASSSADFEGCSTVVACDEIKSDKNTLANASATSFIASGVVLGAATGLLIWAVTGSDPKETSWVLVPVVDPLGGGLRVGARF